MSVWFRFVNVIPSFSFSIGLNSIYIIILHLFILKCLIITVSRSQIVWTCEYAIRIAIQDRCASICELFVSYHKFFFIKLKKPYLWKSETQPIPHLAFNTQQNSPKIIFESISVECCGMKGLRLKILRAESTVENNDFKKQKHK